MTKPRKAPPGAPPVEAPRAGALRREAAKWLQTMQVHWSGQLAYKLHFVLLVLGPTLVFFFVKYNLWTSIYSREGIREIQGYDLGGMLRYQVWVMIVSFLAQGYNALSLAQDIRLGRISAYLVYPFEFWQFHTAGFLATQALQLVVSLLTVLSCRLFGWISLGDPLVLLAGLGFSLLVGCFWFAVSYILGLLAFWLEETWVLRVMFTTVSAFLSGAFLPLEIYPGWLRALLAYTPFPYMSFVPVKIFMGEYTGSVALASLALVAWTGLAALLAGVVWRRGIRLYTAAGM
jgi:ABC-2 type transport system permease protein